MAIAEASLTLQGAQSLQMDFNKEQITAMRNTVAKGATDDEFVMFLHLAKTYQLDPFKREIWFIKMGGTPTIYASRDGFVAHAQRQSDFTEMISHEVCEGDEFSFDPISGEISHKLTAKRGPITLAYAIIRRTDKPDHVVTVPFDEYFNALAAKNGVWKSHGTMMIRKVAEVIACKQTYGIKGLYSQEELGTDEPNSMVDIPYDDGQKAQPTAPVRNHPSREEWLKAINELNAYAESIGLTGDELRKQGKRLLNKENPKQWSLDDIKTIRGQLANVVTSQPEQSAQTDFDLPNDEDLPF